MAEPRELGQDGSWLRFGAEPVAEGGYVGRRLLYVAEKPAFELSFWCGTCPFLFRRLEGANDTGSVPELEARLAGGVSDLDVDVISRFGSILPIGSYIPMLLEIRPVCVRPVLAADYFAEEQTATWDVDPFWGLPQYPGTPYYRTFSTSVDAGSHLYEFVVPMVPPNWNNRARVHTFEAALQDSSAPTAVAVSTLDVCEPAMDHAEDVYAHWGLTHFLLDGHHKMEAAAATGRPLRLLTLLSIGDSLASAEQVGRVAALRARPLRTRHGVE